MALEREFKTYHNNLQSMLQDEGKYVLIHDDEVGGIFDTYEDAAKAGYQKYALEPFLVKKIQAVEQILCFTRDLVKCPT